MKDNTEIWLQNSKEQLDYLEKHSSVAVLVLDRTGRIVHCNQAFLTLLHLPAMPKDRPIQDYLSPETNADLVWENQSAYRQETWYLKSRVGFYRSECHIYTGEGCVTVFIDKPLLTDSSFVQEFDAINRELTALSRELNKKNAAIEAANRSLQEKEIILKQAAEMANIGHWQWSIGTGRIAVSGNLCRLWGDGFQDKTVLDNEFVTHFIPADQPAVGQWLAGMKDTGVAGNIEFRYYGPGGTERYGYCQADGLCDTRSRDTVFVGVFQDITERKLYEKKIEQIAFYDNLTGLPNRKMFEDFFVKEVARAKRQEERVALLMMDLDGFKLVNDNYGHKAGDRVLQVIGERLSASVRIGDTVARLGGDEFIGYLGQLHSEQEALGIAQRIVAACNQPIELEQAETGVGVSIGICFSPRDGADLETLMKKADVAMYQSKAQGKNCVTMYESST